MKIRKSARIIVLHPADAVLLVRYHDPTPANPGKPEMLAYWVPPGGGVDEGESFEQAAIRELEEETGIELSEVGPLIWSRERQLMHRALVDLGRAAGVNGDIFAGRLRRARRPRDGGRRSFCADRHNLAVHFAGHPRPRAHARWCAA